jgi:hypothetical protein
MEDIGEHSAPDRCACPDEIYLPKGRRGRLDRTVLSAASSKAFPRILAAAPGSILGA